MPKPVRIVSVIVVVIAVALAIWFMSRGNGRDNGEIVVSGNIEVTDARLAFMIPGRVSERLVEEGDSVRAGEPVARLDGADQALAVARARANVALAEAVLSELTAGSRPEDIRRSGAQVAQARAQYDLVKNGSRSQEIAAAEAAVVQAKAAADTAGAALELAEADERRSAELYSYGVIPASQHDAASTALTSAERRLDQANAAMDSAEEQLSLVREGPRSEQVATARAALSQAQAAHDQVVAGPRAETIEQAEAQLAIAREALNQALQQQAYTELSAPFDAVVMSKSVEPGEYINPGTTVATIADLDNVWLRAYVAEQDLGGVKLGQRVRVTTDTYPGKTYEGTVSFISDQAEFTPKTVQTRRERVKLVYMIKVTLDNSSRELKPGMPADAVLAEGE